MIYTVETPGIDGLCGVFTSKESLLNALKLWYKNHESNFADYKVTKKQYKKLCKKVLNLCEYGYTSTYLDNEDGENVGEIVIEQWAPNSSRYLTY